MTPRHGTTEEHRSFLQERIALWAGAIMILFGFVFVVALAMFQLYPEMQPPRSGGEEHWLAGAGIAMLALVFVVTRRKVPIAAPHLRLLDASIMVVAGVSMALGIHMAASSAVHIHTPFVMLWFIVFGRVLMVPSSAWRTLTLSTAAMLPLLVAASIVVRDRPEIGGMPLEAYVAGSIVLMGVGVALAAIGSAVIYGLRQEVAKARQLGQYTLDEKIGEGGMGIVYKARHALLRRPTAIKLLPPERVGVESLERFEREVQLTAQLTHPNTVAIYDYGRSEEGVFYYAMEYLEGVDLDTLARLDGPQPAARVISILIQACGALDEAHDRGLIHRDVKPANIILCQRGRLSDVVKLVDFGLVKDLEKNEGTTAANIITGTPEYLAPEAITNPDAVGPASDLYALGAVGFFLLTGEPVFSGATIAEVCAHHVHKQPARPSSLTDTPVPEALEKLLMQCLHKDPAERPTDAASMRETLQALVERHAWTEHDAAAWWQSFDGARKLEPHDIETAATVAVDVRLR